MRLFRYEGHDIAIAPEALLVKEFRALHDRDTSHDKWRAKQELGYVYFMEDIRSDYQYISDREARSREICEAEGMPAEWKPDKAVEAACAYYASKQPQQKIWLDKEKMFIDGLCQAMGLFDPTAVDKNGRLVNTPASTSQFLTTFNKAVIEYTNTLKSVFSSLEQSDKVRGSNAKSDYEDLL